ncbi:MAG: GYF domain-containing protein, partial [Polyangiales bacterium]
YSIADEKVAGKVFKIRCKRCSEVIVVRGDQDSVPPVNSNGSHDDRAGDDAPSEAIWHVVINGEQAGPYTPAQLGEFIGGGQLDWEAYVWCEGFENWQPMRDVPELVSAISGAAGAGHQEEAAASSQQLHAAAQPSMGADPFADELAPAEMYAKAAGGGGGHAVVSRGAVSSSFDSGPSPKMVASTTGPRVTAEQASLTGVRNENSVLFSLKNLQALATGPNSLHPPSTRPGHAAGEGSGLIDIRALATTTGVSDQKRDGSEKDALLSIGSAQAGAFGALGSPMLAPAGKADDEGSKKGLLVAIIGGFGLLAVAAIAVAFIMKPSGTSPAAFAPVAPPPPAAPAAPSPSAAPTRPADTKSAEPPSEGELAATRAAESARANADSEERRHAAGGRRPSAGVDRSPSEPAAPSKPEPAEPTKTTERAEKAGPKKSSPNASIDDLLNDALVAKNAAGGGKREAAASNLQEKPSRDDVLNAMKGVTDEVKACGKGQSGVAFANVTVVGKTGRVSNVEVTGMTGDVGSCIARTVRKASFPKFSAENFQVKYPFRM